MDNITTTTTSSSTRTTTTGAVPAMKEGGSVTYSSTRGKQTNVDFRTVVLQGLASDGGLFVPDTIPIVSSDELKMWRSYSYTDLSIAILSKFIGPDQVPTTELKRIITTSCATFRHSDVTPVKHVGGHAILELFHGPTFAFKDVALQMLGNFFEYFLATDTVQNTMTVLGATSGDTGSAAIAGLRGKKGIQCIILYPDGKVSSIQERQMTSILDDNIHCVAVQNSTFDDCQDIVKASFNNIEFRNKVHLGAINSINWCRVLAQTTYYFWSYFRVTDSKDITEVHYSVPTGNFGDILAGFYSKKMGLPVGKLIVATNENDILHRFFTIGEYHRESVVETISPSMDICVSSNFERYLYCLAGNNATTLATWMKDFETTKKLTITGDLLRTAQMDFDSARCSTQQALDCIQQYCEQYNYILCPHTACGVSAIHQLSLVSDNVVCLATAHDGKFPDAVMRAIAPILPTCPPELEALKTLPTRRTELPNDVTAIQQFVELCVLNETRVGKNSIVTDKQKWILETTIKAISVAALVTATAVAVQVVLNRRKRF